MCGRGKRSECEEVGEERSEYGRREEMCVDVHCRVGQRGECGRGRGREERYEEGGESMGKER